MTRAADAHTVGAREDADFGSGRPGVAAIPHGSLTTNSIGDDGARSLLRALKDCPTLINLQYVRRPA